MTREFPRGEETYYSEHENTPQYELMTFGKNPTNECFLTDAPMANDKSLIHACLIVVFFP